MSRNLRQKSGALPTKKPVRRGSASTTSLSSDEDDDDYAGVDLITDSDEDEPDVEVAEEQAIIESAEEDNADDNKHADDSASSTPRPVADDDQSSWDGFDITSQEDVLGDNVDFFNEHIARMNAPDHDTDTAAWNTTSGMSDDEDTPSAPRRVRFDLSDSSTGLSDNEDDVFPDIFMDQSKLDPTFRKAIEAEDDNNEDEAGGSSDEGSYWDFQGSEIDVPAEESDKGNESDSSTGSSGYETDEGETTEEDLPPAAKYIPARSMLRRPSTSSSSSSESEEEITVTRRGPYRPIKRSGPRLGSWLHDRSKPFLVLDNHGKNLIMFRAKVNRRFSFGGVGNQSMSAATPQSSFARESDQDKQTIDLSPMISNSANLMMSAMYSPLDQYLHLTGGQPLGPPEAFYPFVNISADGTITQDSPSSYEDDEDDEDDVDSEDMWNVEDFLNFGEDTSDEEEVADGREEEDDNTSTIAEPPSSTPARPTTASSEDQIHPLLNHFNSGIVGAFRRNQNRHHLLSCNAASRDSLAFSGPYRQGTLRGIKGDRLAAANTPITPLRKRKLPSSTIPSSPGSPLATAQQKRKFSGDHFGHKRTRSLF
ncbi:hypothetical protein B7463_g2837, partial [Scytalidium lignicola]